MDSTVNPCYVCGLPLTEEYSQHPLQFRCNNEKDCIFREYVDYDHYGCKYSDLTDFNWTYKFKVSGDEQVSINLSILGPWVPTSFDDIIKDASKFAKAYELESFIIENEAGDILYGSSMAM
jgi:hypothetical protein